MGAVTHDPLCHEARCDADRCAISDLLRCQCAIIAKARADEREQAAQRVQLMLRAFRSGFQPYTAFMVGMEHGMNCAIAAARGEEQ